MLNQLLTGMGGVGKTQLAADYARTAWNDGSEAGDLGFGEYSSRDDRYGVQFPERLLGVPMEWQAVAGGN